MAYQTVVTSLIQSLGVRLRQLPGSRLLPWRFQIVGVVDAADEVPDRLAARTAVVVRSVDRPTWIVFDCPRHTSQRIMLNLSSRRWPHWTIHDMARLSLYPSIDAFHGNSRCHFWIQKGRLRWAREPGLARKAKQ